MKSYTDLEQSKKLAEILPLESADMAYIASADDDDGEPLYTAVYKSEIIIQEDDEDIPCWSLAALLEALPDYTLNRCVEDCIIICNGLIGAITAHGSTIIDACVKMIERLAKEGYFKKEE